MNFAYAELGYWNTSISGNASLNNSRVFQNGGGPVNPGESLTIKAVKAGALALIFLFSLIGNPLVIASVFKSPNQRMRTTSNYFIVNLAVADLILTIFQIPRAIGLVYIGRVWLIEGTFGLISCKLVLYIPFVAVFASTLTFLVTAADRFLAVYFPLKRLFEGKTAGLVIGLTWFLPACFYYVYLHYAKLFYLDKTFCGMSTDIIGELFKTMDAYFVYQWMSFGLVIVFPLLLTTAFYAAIAIRLWKTKKPGHVSISERSQRQRTNVKVIKMLAIVVVVFVIGYAPNLISIIMCTSNRVFCSLPGYQFFRFFMLYSNSAVRPFIYPIFNQNFRTGMYFILVGIFRCGHRDPQQVFPLVTRSTTSSSRATFTRPNIPETEV